MMPQKLYEGEDILVVSRDVVGYGMVLHSWEDNGEAMSDVMLFSSDFDGDPWTLGEADIFPLNPYDVNDADGKHTKVVGYDFVGKSVTGDILTTMLLAEGWHVWRQDYDYRDGTKRIRIEATCPQDEFDKIIERRNKIIHQQKERQKEDDGQITLDEVIEKAEAREVDAATA